jgi:hypothetical protein
MWKKIVITGALLFWGLTNAYAADFDYKSARERLDTETIITTENETSFSAILNGLHINDSVKTNLIFGLDDDHYDNLDGPNDPPETTGLGLGFSFSF